MEQEEELRRTLKDVNNSNVLSLGSEGVAMTDSFPVCISDSQPAFLAGG